MPRTFCIVYSNLTMNVFAWEGTPRANKRYLGNREIIGTVKAVTNAQALQTWRSQLPAPVHT